MKLQYCVNRTGHPPEKLALTGLEVQKAAWAFHSTIPGYEATPLTALDHLARRLGVSQVLVKDESKRFGLNAFKALGGSYAMARHLGEQLGLSQDQLTFEALGTPEAREKLGERTFVTATDGNHGRGVAWAARQLGHRAVVYMPKGSARERLENIRAQGAQAEITEYNYDDAVRLANRMAEEHGWILIQDTAWPGYEEIPAHIMQGYTTLAAETLQQLEEQGAERPTHLFLQAGVGSFAGAALGFFTSVWGAGAAGHRHRGARPGRLPVPHRPGRRRGAALRHRGHGQHDGGSVLRRALHHQLEDHRCLRGCLPVLRGRIRRPGNASAGPAGGGRPGGGVRGVRRSDSRGAGCPDAGRRPVRGAAGAGPERVLPGAPGEHRGGHRPGNYQRIINGED